MTPERISSTQLMHEFQVLRAQQDARHNPEPWLCYKPSPKNGTAARLQCRTTVEWVQSDNPDASDRVFRRVVPKGSGLFLDLAPQKAETDAQGNALFHWEPDGPRLTTKLSLADVQAFLLAYRAIRLQGKAVPESVRPKVKEGDRWVTDSKGDVVGTVHKFKDQVTIIDWTFSAKGSFLRIAKPKTKQSRSIPVTLAEELVLVRYLERALDIFLEVGLR